MRVWLAELFLGWRRALRGPLPGVFLLLCIGALLLFPGRDDPGLVRTGYGITLLWMVLLICALWSGGTAYALDRERHRLALFFTKPAHRWQLWWGRFFGTLLPFAALIGGMGLFLVFRPLPEGRRVLEPLLEAPEALAGMELRELRARGRVPRGVPERRLLRAIADDIRTRYTELAPGTPKTYTFRPPAGDPDRPLPATLRLAGMPFLGARDALRLAVTAACGEKTVTLQPQITRDTGFTLPLPDDLLQPGAPVEITLVRTDTSGAASVIYQEYADLSLLLPGQPAAVNLLLFLGCVLLTVAMAVALGTALGASFSLPVTLFTGTLAALALTSATLSPPTSVMEEFATAWSRLSTLCSGWVAQPFRAFADLNPLARLLEGEAIRVSVFSRLVVYSALPWIILWSVASIFTSVRDENL